MRESSLSTRRSLSTFCPHSASAQAQVAGQFKRDPKEFEQTARFWTSCYAMDQSASSGGGVDAKVQKLVEMGFPADKCRVALEKCKGDENAAVEWLFNNAS